MSLEISQFDLFNRLLWALAIVGGGLGLYGLANRWNLRRARGKIKGLESVRPGRPVLLYFTTPTCAPCKTVQRPAIQQLSQLLGDRLQVVEIDASARPDLADYWGVLSVPTTFIIDATLQPRRVNHGVVRLEKLINQFDQLN